MLDLSPILSFLMSKLGYILAAILAIVIYELLKAGGKRVARYITRNKPKAGLALGLAAGIGLLAWLLWVV